MKFSFLVILALSTVSIAANNKNTKAKTTPSAASAAAAVPTFAAPPESKAAVNEPAPEIDTNIIKQEIMADISREPKSENDKNVNASEVSAVAAQTENTKPSNENTASAQNNKTATAMSASTPSGGFDIMDYLKVFASLTVILGLFICCVSLLKKAGKKFQKSQNAQMEIISRLAVAPKRELILARIGDETVLIGSSESGLNYMTTVDSIRAYEQPTNSNSNSRQAPVDYPTNPAEEAFNKLEMAERPRDYKVKLKSRMEKYRPLT